MVWTPLSWDMERDRSDGQSKMESWVCLGRLYSGAVFSPPFIREYNICIYLSQLRAQVREGQSLAFPCADLGGLCRLSLAVAAPVITTPVLQYPASSPFPHFHSKGKQTGKRELVSCTHQDPASAPSASRKALPHVRPLLPTAVTSDPYHSCKLEQGRKNGCAASFFMRQDLLRTIGEINPSM